MSLLSKKKHTIGILVTLSLKLRFSFTRKTYDFIVQHLIWSFISFYFFPSHATLHCVINGKKRISGFMVFPDFLDPESGNPEKCTPGVHPKVIPDPTVPHMGNLGHLCPFSPVTLRKCNIDEHRKINSHNLLITAFMDTYM